MSDARASREGERDRRGTILAMHRSSLSPPVASLYCELHARTAFSFLEGASEPEAVAERARELGLGGVAVTDRAGVYGLPRFAKMAREAGVEAICGAEAVLADGSRLPLLVEDPRGWSNLCRLLTDASLASPPAPPGERGEGRGEKTDAAATEGQEGTPSPLSPLPSSLHRGKGEGRVSWQCLAAHAAGLVALSGGEGGPVVRALRRGGEEAARVELRRLRELFGAERLAVEIHRHGRRGEEQRNAALVALARECGVPVVATQDALCARADDALVADVFACLRAHRTLDTAGTVVEVNRSRHLRSAGAMARLFADLPEAIANTARVAARCAFRLAELPYRFPRARLEGDRSEAEELFARVEAGARERYRTITPRVRAQLDRELSLIVRLGLVGYFLVVHDIVRFCRARGILAQGRGSAANSAVCYALSITAVDPIAMELLFERFLSEERGEWPDIDLDLPSGDLREEVIQFLYRSYGERGAAMTANVITYRGRSAVREVGKVLGFSEEHLGRLARLLGGWGFERDARAELTEHLRVTGLAPEERRSQLLVELVARILRLPRHLGQHSGGMVMARGRLDDVVPLEPAAMPGRVVIQWDKDDCADLGIIKVDLLGLGMLQVLQDAVPLIKQHEGVEVDLAHLPPDDPAVYDALGRADTVGWFQVESRAQMATLPRMLPTRFYDLVVEVAIIRPGPIVGKMVHPYLERRAGRQPVTYPHPGLEPILERTLGVPLFQEQLMRVAMVAAGFSGGQAEELRRAMAAKRSVERMRKLEGQLREGMAARGITGRPADEIVQGITSFALYGFPESHAASFALIAYASGYLTVHHPECFLAALLNAWPMGFYHPATLVQDARRHGVRVLPIDVNRSAWQCRVVKTGDREQGTGNRESKGNRDGADKRLSGSHDVAALDGPDSRRVRGREEAAEGRDSCPRGTAAEGCREHPFEHRRGACPTAHQGVPPAPLDRPRQHGGGVDTPHGGREARLPGARAAQETRVDTAGGSQTSLGSDQSAQAAPLTTSLPLLSPVPRPLSPRVEDGRALAVRLGFRFVKGLREDIAKRIAAEASQAPFSAVRDVARRCGLRAEELSVLAEVGAFASLGQTRRSALWQVSALDGRRPPLAQLMEPDPGASPLPEMTLDERYLADYQSAGVTVGRHPLVLRRAELRARGVLSAAEANAQPHGRRVRVGGVVIVRQRPATAKGLCFTTIEDETGFTNVVFMPDFFKAHRAVITGCALLEVGGAVQSRDGVVTVRADAVRPLFSRPAPATPSRDFH